MAKKQIQLVLNFFGRFLFSFTAIGYHFRKFFWQQTSKNMSDKIVLITGASGGIGSNVVTGLIESGATVLAVARNQKKLDNLRTTIPSNQREHMIDVLCDLSLQQEINIMLDGLVERGEKIDVLVNNVGLMIHELSINSEELETSFATNLLNHYLLTTQLIKRDLLSDNAVVINVSSGGMYNAPLAPQAMNNRSESYNGSVAYTLHKRGQVALTQYWRNKHKGSELNFYVMHPGWVDTDGVKTALPTFRKVLQLILRDEAKGADTIKWLAKEVPDQSENEQIWFDRKPRKIHLSDKTLHASCTTYELIEFLESQMQ